MLKSHGIQPNLTNFSLWTFCKCYSRKVNFSQFWKHYFQNFLGSIPPDPLEWSKKNFFTPLPGSNFLAKNLTLNYYNKLANMYCNRFSTILYIISDNSPIALMKSGMTTKYWFVKIYLNLLPHLCCVSSMFYLLCKQHWYWRRTSSFFRSVVNFPDNYQRYCAQFPL